MTIAHPRRVTTGALLALTTLGATLLASTFVSNAADAGAKAKMDLGRQVFTKLAVPQCSVCHTLKDAGATGTLGAKLDEIKPDEKRVVAAVRGGLGVMPPYQGKLTDAQIESVAYYVARAVREKK